MQFRVITEYFTFPLALCIGRVYCSRMSKPVSIARIQRIRDHYQQHALIDKREEVLGLCVRVLQHARSRIPLPKDCQERAHAAHEQLNAFAAAGEFDSLQPRVDNVRYLVRSSTNPSLILTTSGEFLPESLLGPGGRCAKLYKTERGALASCAPGSSTVHKCDRFGVES